MNIELQYEMDQYLSTLEEVKKQYQQYVEVRELYDLPIRIDSELPRYLSPSLKHPLTTNTFHI